MTRIRLEATVAVTVDVDGDGRIVYVTLPSDDALRDAITADIKRRFTAEDLVARVTHATRCRLDAGLVRVSKRDGQRYMRLVKSGKVHHMLCAVKDPEHAKGEKFSRRNGHRTGGGPWDDTPRIHPDDLAALNARPLP